MGIVLRSRGAMIRYLGHQPVRAKGRFPARARPDRIGPGNARSCPINESMAACRTLGRTTMPSDHIKAESRRRFLQFLATSPLLAASGGAAFADVLLPRNRMPDP